MTDDRVARLYGLPLEQFTAERNALAAALRVEGDRDGAAVVKTLRKPSAAAWAVNQLVRAEPDLVDALLGAGGELRQAHRQAASGHGAEQLRAAAEAERAAVEQLMAQAPAVLGRMVSGALGEAIRNTLHAASSDDEARELVRSGTLTNELRPIGLGPVPAALAGGGGRSARATRASSRRGAGDSARKAKTAVRATDSQQAKSAAAQRADDARREKADAAERARDLRTAKAATAALSREFEAATRALERAEEAYTRAREAADAASERLKEVRKRVREARAGLREAERRQARLERD